MLLVFVLAALHRILGNIMPIDIPKFVINNFLVEIFLRYEKMSHVNISQNSSKFDTDERVLISKNSKGLKKSF